MAEPTALGLQTAYDDWHLQHPTSDGPWHSMVLGFIEPRELVRGKRVLEIGTGSGDFARSLGDLGARQVVGEDFSPTAIAQAIERNASGAVTFAVGDIQNIAHHDGAFDVVISCETIEHVPDPRRAVSELARVLAPGGWLILTSPNYLSPLGVYRAYCALSGRGWSEGGQPLVNWTMFPRSAKWIMEEGLSVGAVDGRVFALPFPGRPQGLRLQPSPRVHRWVKFFARHVLIAAQKSIVPSRRRS